MSTARMRAFLAVARHGSFSAGARALGLSQPTLTTQVQSMERQYNLELFHRRGRRIELSDVGRQLLPIAQAMAALDLDAHNLLRDSGRLDSGQLKIGAVGPFHVIEMVDTYLQQHPNIDVSIRVGNSAQVLSDLENYVTDIAVIPEGATLVLQAGKRTLSLRPDDLEHYKGERGRRGNKLPRGFQRVDALLVEAPV